jgi:hypothetical protein
MTRTDYLCASIAIVGASLLGAGNGHAQVSSVTSRVVRACVAPADCVPESNSVVLVYLYDVSGAPIADMTVDAISGNRPTLALSARTDRQGLAALSVTPGQPYRIRVEAAGWIALRTAERVPAKGAVEVLRIEMRVPPIH